MRCVNAICGIQIWYLFILFCEAIRLAIKQRGKLPKRSDDIKLQALLDELDLKTQSQQAVFNHRTKIGKIQNIGKWIPLELNERNMGTQKHLRSFARTIQKMGMGRETKFVLRIPSRKNHGYTRAAPIDSNTELIWEEDDILCLVGPGGHGIL